MSNALASTDKVAAKVRIDNEPLINSGAYLLSNAVTIASSAINKLNVINLDTIPLLSIEFMALTRIDIDAAITTNTAENLIKKPKSVSLFISAKTPTNVNIPTPNNANAAPAFVISCVSINDVKSINEPVNIAIAPANLTNAVATSLNVVSCFALSDKVSKYPLILSPIFPNNPENESPTFSPNFLTPSNTPVID